METIDCLPQGICSWQFSFTIKDQDIVSDVGRFRDQGWFSIDGERYQIEKESLFGNAWSVKHRGMTVVRAEKAGIFSRCWEIKYHQQTFQLQPTSLFARGLALVKNDKPLLQINRKHPFTRRAVLELQDDALAPELVAFAFWLSTVIWRRKARAAASS